MAAGEIHLNDIGTQFLTTVYDSNNNIVNLAPATTLQLLFKKPDGTMVTQTALLYTDGTDGKMYYNSAVGDLNQLGRWKLQGYVAIGSSIWYTDIQNFKVVENI